MFRVWGLGLTVLVVPDNEAFLVEVYLGLGFGVWGLGF